MAQSRLEKVGTIYSRTCSLISSGAIKEENKPFWLDLYKAFPPKYEPRFDRPGSIAQVRQIFYSEDVIRARFHKDHKQFSMINLLDNKSISKTETFLSIYKELEKDGIPDTEIYDKAVEEFLRKFKTVASQRGVESKVTVSAPEPQRPRRRRGVDVKKHLQEDVNSKSKSVETLTDQNEDEQKYKPIRLSLEKLLQDSDDDIKKSK